MKKRKLKTLRLSKESISTLSMESQKGGREAPIAPASTQGGCGSQNNSQCGYSCDPNLCGSSVEPWCIKN